MITDPYLMINGFFSILVVIIFFLIGILILIRYFKYKRRVFLYGGFALMGMGAPWLSSSISFLLLLFIGKSLDLFTYLLISIIVVPFAFLNWLAVFTELKYKRKQKIIMLIFGIYSGTYIIAAIYLLFNYPYLIGELQGPIDSKSYSIKVIYTITVLIIISITAILFGQDSMKSEKPELRLKGKLIIISVLIFTIGAVADNAISLDAITLPLVRILLCFSAILAYGGFILPEWMKKIFFRQESE